MSTSVHLLTYVTNDMFIHNPWDTCCFLLLDGYLHVIFDGVA